MIPPAADLVVLGSRGQLARELQRAPLPRGWSLQVLGSDRLDLGGADDAAGTLAAGLDGLRNPIVVNAAAYTAVDAAESDTRRAFAINAVGPGRVADLCAGRGVPLIHVSTDYVFDGTKAAPYAETDGLNPLGVYGASKAEGERRIREALDRHVILRTSWVYSPFGSNFVRTMLRLGGERPVLSIVDDQTGCPTAARDLAAAVLAVAAGLAAGRTDGFGTFHFAGTGSCSWFGFAQAIFTAAHRHGRSVPRLVPIPTADYPLPARRPANSRLDCARIAAVWGIVAPAWTDSLVQCVGELLEASSSAVQDSAPPAGGKVISDQH